MSAGSIDCRPSWSLSWWDLSVSPRVLQLGSAFLLPTSAEGFSFIGVSTQRWAVSALVLPFCKWSRPCRISINPQRVCVCVLPAAQNELSVVAVNGKGHLSSRLCWLATKAEKGSEARGTDEPQRQRRLNYWRRGWWLHCNQLCGVFFFSVAFVEKS